MDLILNSSITHSLLLVLPVALAYLLRRAGCPGWPVVAGALAGVVLGPTILGRLAPDLYEHRFVGGVEEREAVHSIRRRQTADLIALRAAGGDETLTLQTVERHRNELVEPLRAWKDAQWSFQRPFRTYGSAIVVAVLLGAGLIRRPIETDGTRGRGTRGRLPLAASIGVWSACVPGGLTAAVMIAWWSHPPAAALAAAAAVAIGPWVLTRDDWGAADDAEIGGGHTVEHAGRIASLLAVSAAAFAVGRGLGTAGLVWCAPLGALVAGWWLPVVRGDARDWARIALLYGAVPILAACVALRFDLLAHFTLAPVVLLVVLSGDGRWLGAFAGATLPGGRRAIRGLRLVIGSMACAPTQLAVTLVGAHTGLLPEPITLALLVGAIALAVTSPARRRVTRWLEEAEDPPRA